MPREGAARQPWCADIDGFSLHAAVRVEAHDRRRLEQLGRDITRPALSDERVQLNAAGQLESKLKTPWRDGTTPLVMSPLEFMQRLAAPVPQPRLHRITGAQWLERVFDIDVQHCSTCGAGERKLIAAILERRVIEKTLTPLRLDAQPPPKGPAGEPGRTSLPEPRSTPAVQGTSPRLHCPGPGTLFGARCASRPSDSAP